jgi:hypothetical protein
MTEPFTFSLTDSPSQADRDFIEEGLEAFNRQYAPDDGYRPLAIFVHTA